MEQFLNISSTADVAILGILIALFIIYAVWQSTGLLLSLALSLPIAGFLFTAFPYHSELTSIAPWSPLVLFALLVLLTLWIFQRTVGIASGSGRPIHIVTTAIALAVLLISFSYHVVPLEGIYDFGSTFDSFFGSTTYFFWIVALAMLALFVV